MQKTIALSTALSIIIGSFVSNEERHKTAVSETARFLSGTPHKNDSELQVIMPIAKDQLILQHPHLSKIGEPATSKN